MAIFHLSVRMVQRSKGHNIVAVASDRIRVRLYDQRLGLNHRIYPAKRETHPILSEIFLPSSAPQRWLDREILWNEVEAIEHRKDSALGREVEFAMPSEVEPDQAAQLARDYILQTFVSHGMVVDLNVYYAVRDNGQPKPYAHALLTTRYVTPIGFGKKVIDWNQRPLIFVWRKNWQDLANLRLSELGHAARIDCRSYKEQGVDRVPQNKIGPNAARRARRGEASERVDEHLHISRQNQRRSRVA